MRLKQYINEGIDMSEKVGTVVHIEDVRPEFRYLLGKDAFILGKEYVKNGKIYKKEYYKNSKPKKVRQVGDAKENGLHYILFDEQYITIRVHNFTAGLTTKRTSHSIDYFLEGLE